MTILINTVTAKDRGHANDNDMNQNAINSIIAITIITTIRAEGRARHAHFGNLLLAEARCSFSTQAHYFQKKSAPTQPACAEARSGLT